MPRIEVMAGRAAVFQKDKSDFVIGKKLYLGLGAVSQKMFH